MTLVPFNKQLHFYNFAITTTIPTALLRASTLEPSCLGFSFRYLTNQLYGVVKFLSLLCLSLFICYRRKIIALTSLGY